MGNIAFADEEIDEINLSEDDDLQDGDEDAHEGIKPDVMPDE
jgi:hypothetical protein